LYCFGIYHYAEFGRKLFRGSACVHGAVYEPPGKSLHILCGLHCSRSIFELSFVLFYCAVHCNHRDCFTGTQREEEPADCASGVPELHQVIAGAAPLAYLVVLILAVHDL
jgi:hypothetical protein